MFLDIRCARQRVRAVTLIHLTTYFKGCTIADRFPSKRCFFLQTKDIVSYILCLTQLI